MFTFVAAAHAATAPHLHAPDALSFALAGFWGGVVLGWMSKVGGAGAARQGTTSM